MTETLLPDRYRLLRLLGRGGQASVYLAADRFCGNAWVAVKAIRWSGAAPRHEKTLRDEFLVLTRLAHPNLARVRDFGYLRDESGAYFTSDYVRGGNLIEWALDLSPAERWSSLLDVAVQALSALHYLSLRKVCHGDLKPANLMVECLSDAEGGRPRLKVIDFGAARARYGSEDPAIPVGTRAYLAPPSLRGGDAGDEGIDLYSLGMALFHAGVGRLPFAVGDSCAIEDWWARGVAARPSELAPEVPEPMDLLIAGLTSVSGERRFRTAGEALEFLRRRVHLPPPVRIASGEEVWTSGRELFVERLLDRVVEGGAASRILAIAGPRGSGKTRVLEALGARLQVGGFRSVLFSGPGDTLPLSELETISARCGDASAPVRGLDVPELVARLRSERVAILLDDEESSSPTPAAGSVPPILPLFPALARSLSRASSSAATSCLVVTTTEPERLARLLDVRRQDLEIQALEALSRESLAEMSREFFAVEVVPEVLLDHLEKQSGGLPGGVLHSLSGLAAAGVAADSFGHLRMPDKLPAPDERAPRGGLEDLPAPERRALGLFALAGEPLDPASISARFPEQTAETWHALLESLRVRGFLRCEETESQSYRLAGRGLSLDTAALLEPGERIRARKALKAYFERALDRGSPARPDTLLGCARNLLALGEAPAAVACALRAVRRLGRVERYPEALEVLREVVSALGDLQPLPASARERRRVLQPRLRAARIMIRLGEAREALSVLEAPHGGTAPWYDHLARWLRVDALEALGSIEAAIDELEFVHAPGSEATAGAAPSLTRLASVARLAPLYFRAGRGEEGRRCLDQGRSLLQGDPGNWQSHATRYGEILAYFARAESAHGTKEHASSLLEKSIEVSRHLGRDDLAWRSLNELGILHAQARRFDDAHAVLEESEERARRSGDRMGALKSIFNRAVIHYRLNKLEEAEALFSRARGISDSLGPHGLSAAIWNGHAGVLQERGRLLEALRLYRRVLRLSGVRTIPERVIAHNNLGELYLLLGRLRQAALHANLAFRLARRIRDRFRESLTLRVRGIVRWALGCNGRARRDLEAALQRAREDSDLRAQGVALHYLGLLAAREGDLGEALRRLRCGIQASASAGDQKYIRSGKLAVLCELVRRDRRTAARRLLSDDGAQTAGGIRGGSTLLDTFGGQWLAALASQSWPDNAGSVLELLGQAEADGHLWDAFRALVVLLEDPLPRASDQRELFLRLEFLVPRLLRGLGRRRIARFRRAWKLRGETAVSAPRRDGRSDERAGSVPLEEPPKRLETPRIARDSAGSSLSVPRRKKGRPRMDWTDPKTVVDQLLEEVREKLGWHGAWLIEEPGSPLPGGVGETTDPQKLRKVLREHAAAIDRARRSPRPVYEPPLLLIRLPNPDTRPVLCLEAPPGAWESMTSGLEPLWAILQALALAVRVADLDRDLSAERDRHSEAREEVHRLNTLLVRDRKELETALTTRSLELLDLRRGASGAGPGHARRRPVGTSPAMRELLSRIPRIARRDLPVLILGESGVGKDLFARCIHDVGPRSERPFLAEICNITESLMETELFGFVRGAFTGAVMDRPGVFERADGGSIYLDEIADLSLPLQVRLLRVLEEKTVRPVGGEENRVVEFRLLSSSRRSREELEDTGVLRQDLLYRINTEVLEIPPLRERSEDIPVLVDEILRGYCRDTGFPAPYVHKEVHQLLRDHGWPGNVRELENTFQRVLVTRPPEITVGMFSLPAEGSAFSGRESSAADVGDGEAAVEVLDFREARHQLERQLVLRALQAHGGNATRAAEALKITRRYLGTLLSRHGIRLEEHREEHRAPGRESPHKSASDRSGARSEQGRPRAVRSPGAGKKKKEKGNPQEP